MQSAWGGRGVSREQAKFKKHIGVQAAWAYLVRKYCAQLSGARRDWAALPSREVLAQIAADIDIPLGFLESEPHYADPLYTADEGHEAREIFAEYFKPRSVQKR